jgi:subtilisin family serine protease
MSMSRSAAIAAFILLLASPLAGQEPSRLDPALRLLLHTEPLARTEGLPPGHALPRLPIPGRPTVVAPDAAGGPLVRVLARVEPAGEAAILAAGGRIGVRVGDIVTARLPLQALRSLASAPGIRFLEAAAVLGSGALLAHGIGGSGGGEMVEAGADRLRQRSGHDFHGLAGQGVIVGIYDSGLDLEHADFRRGDATRVRYAWDQTAGTGRPPGMVAGALFDYGHECGEDELRGGTCPLLDRTGHGTHVAGTAAGSGAATGGGMPAYRFPGVAPEAELIVVKGGDATFSADLLVEGVAYIFARAAELGRPAVVNLSISSQSGPHDGTTLLEQALDRLSGPGRIIIAAAGNQGTNANERPAFLRAPIHAAGVALQGVLRSHDLVVPAYPPRPGAINDGAVLELWYDGRDSLAILITTPGGATYRVATGDSLAVETGEGAIFVANAVGGPSVLNGDHGALVGLLDVDAAAPPAAGRWTIAVEGTAIRAGGAYHLWLVGHTLRTAAAAARLDRGTSNSHVVAVPASASRLLAAAAYSHRDEWLGPEGAAQAFPFLEPAGDIAFFSSPGPRRDGVLKPDIAAPGKVVISSRSRTGTSWDALPWLIESDGVHAGLLGTSMAAPHVAGAVALLLQLRPHLTPEEARDLLSRSARADAFTRLSYDGRPPATPNAQWGYGKLNVEAAVWRLGLPAGSIDLQFSGATEQRPLTSRRGERLPLLGFTANAGAVEAVAIEWIDLEVSGTDTAAALLLIREDATAAAEPVVRIPLRLDGRTRSVRLEPGPVVPAGRGEVFSVAIETSGAAPNGARFAARLGGGGVAARGTLSGAALPVNGASAPGARGERVTTLLEPGERLNLSANPVRGGELVLNYAEPPRAIHVHTLAGRRVYRMPGHQLEPGRAVWRLVNDAGHAVANGVYMLVVEFEGSVEVRKIVVARRAVR